MGRGGVWQSRLRRGLAATGTVIAVPLRVVDALWGVPHSSRGSQVVQELQRLAQLHASGQLTDREYAAAKDRVLGGSG